MRSTGNIWYRNRAKHWTSGDFTLVPMSMGHWGLVRGGKFLSKHEDREDAAKASWSGESVAKPIWVLR